MIEALQIWGWMFAVLVLPYIIVGIMGMVAFKILLVFARLLKLT